MKLWLQLLFAQGWLWRDRFPERFTQAKASRYRIDLFLVILPLLFIGLSIGQLIVGDWESGVGILALGLSWLLWRASVLGLTEDAGHKELRLTASWTAGFVFFTTTLVATVIGAVIREWGLLALAIASLLCLGSSWLQALQTNYLFFRDPANNMWRLEDRPPQKGVIQRLAAVWLDAYWRLPRQILFP